MNTDWQLECIGIRNRGAHILKTGEFSDCTFMVGSEQVKISAHKIILAMSSPVFQAMFYASVADSGEVISIVDIESDVFKSLLVYIYADEIEVDSYKKARELYYAAKKYMLPHLTKECITYLASNLCAENALMVYEFAVFNDNEDLIHKCTKVICAHAKEVLKASTFTEARLGTVCMMFSMDPLNIDSELDLFAAAERYLIANKDCAYPSKVNEPMSTDDTTPSDTIKSSTSLNTQYGDTKGRPKAKFKFTVGIHNIGTVNKYVYSQPYYIRDLPWRIAVGPKNKLRPDGQHQKALSIFLQCNEGSESTCWSCYASFTLKVICHNPKTKGIWRRSHHLFHSEDNKSGCSRTIAWIDVLDPEKGYVKDGIITVQANVQAEAPHGVLGNSAKHISLDHRDKLTIRNAVRLIRFLTLTSEQFADGAIKSALLDTTEEHAILINLASKKPCVSMPQGFCNSTTKRKK